VYLPRWSCYETDVYPQNVTTQLYPGDGCCLAVHDLFVFGLKFQPESHPATMPPALPALTLVTQWPPHHPELSKRDARDSRHPEIKP